MADKYILTEEECLAKGGHIWDNTMFTCSLGFGMPSKEQPAHRVCKYCGQKQQGYHPPIVWEDQEVKEG